MPALRLELSSGEKLLLDRGSARKLTELGKIISAGVAKHLAIDSELQTDARIATQLSTGTEVV